MKFKNLAEEWRVEIHATQVTADTALKAKNELTMHLYPELANKDVDKITPKCLLNVIKQVEKDVSAHLAKRILQRCDAIFSYGCVMGYINSNPAYNLNKFLSKHISKHRAYLNDDNQLSQLFADISNQKNINKSSKVAFWVIVYTACRRSEVCLAKRVEFDLKKGTWQIPAKRMKTRTNHTVMLSQQVINLLSNEFNRIDSPWAFASNHKKGQKHIDPWTPHYMMTKAGWQGKQTIHGFRHLFSTHAHESGLWSVDSIELSLSHKIQGIRGVYNHATLHDERTKLMQWYADEVDKWRGIT